MTYGLTVSTPPAVEPVTLAEAKAHLRIETSSDDTVITALIVAARQQLEEICNRAFVTQTLVKTMECWPACGCIRLPRPRAIAVTSVKYLDAALVLQTVDPANYVLTAGREPAEIWPVNGYCWPSPAVNNPNAVQVTWTAGYGPAAADVPELVKHAIKFLVAHWYENRETVNIGNIVNDLPFALQSLIDLIRVRVI